MIKPSTVRQIMFERLEEGMNTKIPADNKGYQLLLKLGFKEGGALGKSKVMPHRETVPNGSEE